MWLLASEPACIPMWLVNISSLANWDFYFALNTDFESVGYKQLNASTISRSSNIPLDIRIGTNSPRDTFRSRFRLLWKFTGALSLIMPQLIGQQSNEIRTIIFVRLFINSIVYWIVKVFNVSDIAVLCLWFILLINKQQTSWFLCSNWSKRQHRDWTKTFLFTNIRHPFFIYWIAYCTHKLCHSLIWPHICARSYTTRWVYCSVCIH